MNNSLISIVVPVYNAEKTIERCIKSLLGQTYIDFEAIIIDDGSTDHSFSLCKKYVDIDKRIKVFRQKNAGVSKTRNQGIRYAEGAFLTFIDSDDYVGENYLKELIGSVPLQLGKGVIIGGVTKIYSDGAMCTAIPDARKLYRSEIEKIYENEYIHQYWGAASKLYDLTLIRKNGIEFNERLNYGEDAIFLLSYLKEADYVCFSSTGSYYYVHHEGISLSRSLRPYKTEITVYRLIKKQIGWRMPVTLSTYLIRALAGLYRIPGKLNKKERLKELKLLTKEDLKLLQRYYFPSRMWEKTGKFLIKRNVYMYDLYMSFMYFLDYSFKKIKS